MIDQIITGDRAQDSPSRTERTFHSCVILQRNRPRFGGARACGRGFPQAYESRQSKIVWSTTYFCVSPPPTWLSPEASLSLVHAVCIHRGTGASRSTTLLRALFLLAVANYHMTTCNLSELSQNCSTSSTTIPMLTESYCSFVFLHWVVLAVKYSLRS